MLLSLILGIATLLVHLINLLLVVYCVMSFAMPDSNAIRKAARYVEPMLRPFREFLYRRIPRLATLPVDVSPLALWLVLDVLLWVLNLLQHIF